jgi:predicted nucleic acid-binding Zn ribbon protein
MSKMLHGSIKPIGSALDELVQSLGIKKKLLEYDAVVYWEAVAGKQIAKMATATRITQGVLFVHVKTSTWRNELTMRKKEIINKLNSAIGFNVVKDIKFQ